MNIKFRKDGENCLILVRVIYKIRLIYIEFAINYYSKILKNPRACICYFRSDQRVVIVVFDR